MRFCLCVLVMICPLSSCPAQAGAWLREKGAGFASISFAATYFLDTEQKTYLEYGVRDDLTLGADIAIIGDQFGNAGGYATLFLRRPIGGTDSPHRWAYELGVGAAWAPEIVTPYIKTGLSWGRGIQIRETYGWVTVDASVSWDLMYGVHVTKVDSTVGLTFNDTFAGMLQLYTANVQNENFATIAPSLLISPSKDDSAYRFQVGTETLFGDIEASAIKIGLWREF